MTRIKIGKAFPGPFLLHIILLLNAPALMAQTGVLPVNESGKVSYQGSIPVDSATYLVLWDRATKFLNTLSVPDQIHKEAESNAALTELFRQFGFYLYVKPGLTRQIDGVVIADIHLGISEKGYAYRIDNYTFIKYARNRFGNFTPKTSRRYPLESYYPDSKKKSWETHFETINVKMTDLIGKLEENMRNKHKSP